MKKFVFILLMLMVLGFSQAYAITYNDGAVHNITTAILEDVYVYNGQTGLTTVNVLSGGSVSSDYNDGDALFSYGNSIVNVMGGTIFQGIYTFMNSKINISEGVVEGILTYNNSKINISGGVIEGIGGGVYGIADSPEINISGGVVRGIRGGVLAYAWTTVNISGGAIDGGDGYDLMAYSSATFNIYGTNFAYTSIGPGPASGAVYGSISGTLLDGSIFDWRYLACDASKFILITEGAPSVVIAGHGSVPEPTTMLLLGLGLMGLAGIRRKL